MVATQRTVSGWWDKIKDCLWVTFRLKGNHGKIRKKTFHAEKSSEALSLVCFMERKRLRERSELGNGPRRGREVCLGPDHVGYLYPSQRFILRAIRRSWMNWILGKTLISVFKIPLLELYGAQSGSGKRRYWGHHCSSPGGSSWGHGLER